MISPALIFFILQTQKFDSVDHLIQLCKANLDIGFDYFKLFITYLYDDHIDFEHNFKTFLKFL